MEQTVQGPNEAHASMGSFDSSRENPALQKRAHDYGEELKGLSASGDEGSSSEASTSAFKRRKVTRSADHSGSNSGSDSEDLDDGEIVESPEPCHVTPPDTTVVMATTGQDGVELQGLDTLSTPKSAFPEVGKRSPSPASRDSSARTGDTDDGRQSRKVQENTDVSSTNQNSLTSISNWNHGIQLGTRTGFGAKATNSFFGGALPSAAETGGGSEPPQPKKGKKRVQPDDPISSFEASNATWRLPSTAQKIVATKTMKIPEKDGFWTKLLKDWISHLVQVNRETADRLTFKVVRSGWAIYFTRRTGFVQGTKKNVIATRTVAQSFLAALGKESIQTMIADACQKHSVNQPSGGTTTTTINPSPPSHSEKATDTRSEISVNRPATSLATADSLTPCRDEEFSLQKRYFPNTSDPSRFCLSCTGTGHDMLVCPELNCSFCNDRDHSSFGCPTKRRCEKCRQIGHDVDTCQEKLALAPDELGGCAFCGAGHEDDACSEIWRSFKPSQSNLKKVKSIPVFCYVCGGENHYGPECSLDGGSGKAVDHTTWSKTNRNLYIDPGSENLAIAWTSVDHHQPVTEEFHIRGRATRKTHTYFVSSDESEEDLIHAPVTKNEGRKEIRIASNIGAVNVNPRGHGGGHKPWQPPLPPGPPPSLQATQSTPSGTLPPRPQTFTHGRPSGRGRGGYRGRARGRGRGK